MPRMLQKETVTNLAATFAKLRAAVVDIRAEEDALIATESHLTPEGKRDALNRKRKLENVAVEMATILASRLSQFAIGAAKNNPEILAKMFGVLAESEIPQIVEIFNETREQKAAEAKENQRVRNAEDTRQKLAKLGIEVSLDALLK